MIIIGKYARQSKIRRIHSKGSRLYSYLFDPVIGIGRDHCRIQSDMFRPKSDRWNSYKSGYKLQIGCWYIIYGKIERYIDFKGCEKTSITPSSIHRIWGLSICQRDYIRGVIKKVKKRWNIWRNKNL